MFFYSWRIFLPLIISSTFWISDANRTFNDRKVNQLVTLSDEREVYHREIIDYIDNVFCFNGSYRSFHIYIEKSVRTALPDKLIHRLNKCMEAGILTTR